MVEARWVKVDHSFGDKQDRVCGQISRSEKGVEGAVEDCRSDDSKQGSGEKR